MTNYDPTKAAEHEIGWWMAHHRKDTEGFLEHKIGILQIEYDLTRDVAEAAVSKYMAAAKEHDIAEKLEDEGNKEGADTHWRKAQVHLTKFFRMVHSRR